MIVIARGRVRTTAGDRVAQHGGRTPNNRFVERCNLGLPCTSLILNVHVISNWHLSKQGICWPVSRDHIAGSSLQHRGYLFFWDWPLTKCWFFDKIRAHVRLACLKHFMIVRKLANASPGLKSIRFITFSSIQMFSCFILCFIKLNTENLTAKLQNSNQNCTFSWVSSLIGFSTTWPRSYAFRLA